MVETAEKSTLPISRFFKMYEMIIMASISEVESATVWPCRISCCSIGIKLFKTNLKWRQYDQKHVSVPPLIERVDKVR